ncbi:MAG: sigma-70 family RNA polymerase sigma factor [Bryobacteraceae bacterium]|nr:sigma-70 family RNA polymerase sigma factor [Bryobacteraceae bacterium]
MLITDSGSLSMDFESLVRQHEVRVLRLTIRLTGNHADGQDAAQEVFLRLHQNLSRLHGPEAVLPWLRRVAVNVCFDLGRRARSRPVVPLDSLTLATGESDPEAQAFTKESRDQLQRALAQLGERERTALVLRELEGLSTAEVAETLGTAESTIRVQIARARLKLRELLKGVTV